MPKVTGELFHSIKEKYGNVSSWALWATSENSKTKLGMDDISFFENPSDTVLDVLNPNIVLVGLNISERIERIFGNFHEVLQKYPALKEYRECVIRELDPDYYIKLRKITHRKWKIIKASTKLLSLHQRAVLTANHPERLKEIGAFDDIY
jgi:hypothetical protein